MRERQLFEIMKTEDRPYRGILDKSGGYNLCGVGRCQDMNGGLRCHQPCYDDTGLCYHHGKKKEGRINK
jgi:hypothetical protein